MIPYFEREYYFMFIMCITLSKNRVMAVFKKKI